MSIRINITIKDELNNVLMNYKRRINVSKICAIAIKNEIDRIKLQDKRDSEVKNSVDEFCKTQGFTLEELNDHLKRRGQ